MRALEIIGALADHHPVAVFRMSIALALFGASFLVCVPIWAAVLRRRRSARRFHKWCVLPFERRAARRRAF